MSADAQQEKIRQEVRAWLSDHWKGVDDAEWREQVVLAGWAAPTFPQDAYGLGMSVAQAKVVAAEFADAGAPRSCQDLGVSAADGWIRMAGLAVARYGQTELKKTFVRDLLTGGTDGVALYSEPSAGSDLASLQTRAVLAGDHWVVNGQKVWSSSAAEADWGLLLARTNEDVPKHQGISFFILPMHQPGIDIRPIKQITGDSEFSEVFLTDVRVPVENVVGDVDDGWAILQVVLAAEREWLGAYLEAGNRPGIPSDELDRSGVLSSEGAADLIGAARGAGRLDDASVRQTIAHLHTWRLVHSWNNERFMSGDTGGSGAVAAAALGKLASSRILHEAGRFKAQMAGPDALLYGPENRIGDNINREVMNAFINSVGGGSDQIQRNIVSERLLGLPRGHAPDRGVPFKDIKKSAAQPAARG